MPKPVRTFAHSFLLALLATGAMVQAAAPSPARPARIYEDQAAVAGKKKAMQDVLLAAFEECGRTFE